MHIYLPCDIFFFKISTFKLPKGNFILEIQRREKSHRIFSNLTEIWNQTHRLAIWAYGMYVEEHNYIRKELIALGRNILDNVSRIKTDRL